MGRPSTTGAAAFRILAVVSTIFALGALAVSAALLHQAINLRDTYYYGAAGAYGYGNTDYLAGRGGGYYGGAGGGFGGGIGVGYGGGTGFYGGTGIGYQDVGFDIYRYHRVVTVAAVALGAAIIQFLVSLLLCCVNEDNTRGMAIGYVSGALFVFLVLAVCFGLAFQYRVIYPYYFYNYYQLYIFPSVYYQYNPEGQAFCALIGIDLIYLLVSAIVAGVFAKKAADSSDKVEWHVRPTTASSSGGNNEYRA